jgi:hypothetical protein
MCEGVPHVPTVIQAGEAGERFTLATFPNPSPGSATAASESPKPEGPEVPKGPEIRELNELQRWEIGWKEQDRNIRLFGIVVLIGFIVFLPIYLARMDLKPILLPFVCTFGACLVGWVVYYSLVLLVRKCLRAVWGKI